VKKLVAILAALVALGAASSAHAAWPCGLPPAAPLWVDFADTSVDFRYQVFGKPGLVLASSGLTGPAQLRALGAQTVYWHMKLQRLVGTPTVPADPATIQGSAEALLQRAIASSGCETPVIALNELFGVHRQTPWLYEMSIYRANVLHVLKILAEKGAVPFLLVPGPPRGNRAPFVGGEASAWWLEVAKHAHIVRQVHFNAPYAYGLGTIVGSRTRRISMRDSLQPLLAIGVPAERLGILVGFQSGPGRGGREGLAPREAWLDIVKREALSVRHVATELGVSTIWSWGWGTFDPQGADPDKPIAACVFLWARDPALCDGPTVAGPRFDPSLAAGQIVLPAGVQCQTGVGLIDQARFEELATGAGSRQLASTALLNRLLYDDERIDASPSDVERMESIIIARDYAGDASAYEAALASQGLSRGTAQELIADQIRRSIFDAQVQVRYLTTSPESFTMRRQRDALRTAICLRDELPAPGSVDWAERFPLLTVPEASISIAAERYNVRRGARIVLSGRLRSELPGERVTLYVRGTREGSYRRLATVAVGADGSFSLRVRPRGTSFYRAVSRSAASLAIIVRAHR
jgi:hypothetical protein